ncbi:hypothetical protein MNBD_GAMMA21-1261 [hydrothermal vent metagenome]|uniref:Uncharacterized protein n=1 Tax=hydrothermal vent metagenome TaxID=652676 RepID=A0A3B0ZG33_9ZZZZ
MRLPNFLYESYPVIYVIGGIIAMSTVESYLSFLSGLLLAMGGISILFMRRNYRMIKDQLAHLT